MIILYYLKKEIAKKCNCSIEVVKYVVSQYRDDVDWVKRYSTRQENNCLGVKGLSVECIETGKQFNSCTQASNWLIKEGKIKSQAYGRNKIPLVCRGERKTVGGYHWKFI